MPRDPRLIMLNSYIIGSNKEFWADPAISILRVIFIVMSVREGSRWFKTVEKILAGQIASQRKRNMVVMVLVMLKFWSSGLWGL